jgi:signal transduction histidine kinase
VKTKTKIVLFAGLFWCATIWALVVAGFLPERWVLLPLGIVGIVLGIRNSWGVGYVATRILGRIEKSTTVAKSIARGQFEKRAEPTNDELSQLAGELTKFADKLGELDHLRGDFISSISHELEPPLTAIEHYIDFFIEGLDTEIKKEKQIKALNIMKHNASRLGNLINDILDLAKIEAGQLEVKGDA